MGFKRFIKRSLRSIFEVGQKVDLDLLPRHSYSEIPSIPLLRATTSWRRPLSMNHVAGTGLKDQLAFIASCTSGFEASMTADTIHQRACEMNRLPEGFGIIEVDFLYAFVRSQKPPRIIQIGCGVSTAVCMLAASDARYKPEIICVAPSANQFITEQAAAGDIRLIISRYEDSSLPIAELLQDGGLLFIDSTHTLGPAGEVTRLVCEVLPTLPAGTWVHFHDILFPYDYSPDILTSELFFSHETALLYAFLLLNSRYSVAASLSMLHHACPAELATYLPNYQPAKFDQGLRLGSGHHPSSLYLRVQ